ncbi:unnamed protein product [Phytomonas sp. Hart1]|nr:unnamed protein product [Phytomonas sp. Hart1]|eukprot:CCW66600.1 unnamed protein product [Phytomonas sp. isolate Hart1]
MLKSSSLRLSLFLVIKTEFLKIPNYISYLAREQTKVHTDYVSKGFEFLKGKSFIDDQATAEKRKRHKEMYEAILRKQAIQLHETKISYEAELKKLAFKERLKAHWKNLRQSMQEATSTKAGVMTLLQHCAASHAAEIAIEENIDVKDVQFAIKTHQDSSSIAQEATVVGYIDAPSASEEEFAMFVEKLQKACPVANRMAIEWRNSSFADRNKQMEFPSQWPNSDRAAFDPYDFRKEIASKGGENDAGINKFSSDLRHEGMSFRDLNDLQAKDSQSKNVERNTGKFENQQDKTDRKAVPEVSNQGEQQQAGSEVRLPHGTPGEHRMNSTGNDLRNPSSLNHEEVPTANGDKKC